MRHCYSGVDPIHRSLHPLLEPTRVIYWCPQIATQSSQLCCYAKSVRRDNLTSVGLPPVDWNKLAGDEVRGVRGKKYHHRA